ncbi:MAG: outer membrane beta-barrel protein [Cyclobacteriaceae bacterium]|nr:outer membrane beta-barrel protein [Cyclobacteriaceae bacterium]
MRRFITLLAFVGLPVIGQSQDWYVTASGTYTTNSMSQLKTIQESYVALTGLPLQTLTSFPPYWGFGVAVGRSFNERYSLGLSVNYTSTGGRVYYEDYSGSVYSDQILEALSLEPYLQYRIIDSPVWPVYVSLGLTWVQTNMSFSEVVSIGGQSSKDIVKFHSNNFGLKPLLVGQRNFGDFFLQASLGFEIQLAGKLYVNGTDNVMTTPSGEPATAQWTGLRAGLGIGIFIRGKETDQNK